MESMFCNENDKELLDRIFEATRVRVTPVSGLISPICESCRTKIESYDMNAMPIMRDFVLRPETTAPQVVKDDPFGDPFADPIDPMEVIASVLTEDDIKLESDTKNTKTRGRKKKVIPEAPATFKKPATRKRPVIVKEESDDEDLPLMKVKEKEKDKKDKDKLFDEVKEEEGEDNSVKAVVEEVIKEDNIPMDDFDDRDFVDDDDDSDEDYMAKKKKKKGRGKAKATPPKKRTRRTKKQILEDSENMAKEAKEGEEEEKKEDEELESDDSFTWALSEEEPMGKKKMGRPKVFCPKKLMRKHKKYTCKVCGILVSHITAHMRSHNSSLQLQCPQCDKKFLRTDNLQMHIRRHNGDAQFTCEHCSKSFYTRHTLKHHLVSSI